MPGEALPIRAVQTMPDDWMTDGLRRTLARVRSAAVDSSDGDAREIVIAVFEASSWAGAIAERRQLGGDTRVQGIRHLRDRMLHGAAGAVGYFDHERGTWRWALSEDLPPPTDDRQERRREFYDFHLAGEPVVDIFDYFDRLISESPPSA
jgi:hypothetical protein